MNLELAIDVAARKEYFRYHPFGEPWDKTAPMIRSQYVDRATRIIKDALEHLI